MLLLVLAVVVVVLLLCAGVGSECLDAAVEGHLRNGTLPVCGMLCGTLCGTLCVASTVGSTGQTITHG